MKKIIITTGCDLAEPWWPVLQLTVPRFQRYALRHRYDFEQVWYPGIDSARFPEFENPGPFVDGAVNPELRGDFILWRLDKSKLAPNWLRYAATIQLLDEYDVVVYLDADLVIADFEHDLLDEIPADRWLAASICGPSPDNAGPGGPMFVTRSCPESKAFWRHVWAGRAWISHPWWTDGVDFMDLLGYTIVPPVHKGRATEYDAAFHRLDDGWIGWGDNPPVSRFYHMSQGNSGDAAGKLGAIQGLIRGRGL